MSPRILHVATRHRVGGAERNLRHTVSTEVSKGFDVHVAVGTEDLVHDFPPGVQVHPVPELFRELSPTNDARALKQLCTMIRRLNVDVVHTHQSKAGVLGRLAALSGRNPIVVHTVHMPSFGPGYSRGQDKAFRFAERALARRTDCSVFVGSDLMQRYLNARAVHPSRSRVIHSPIFNIDDLLAVRERPDTERVRYRQAIGLPDNVPMVLAVGALDRRKRHQLLISSLAPLLATGEATLLIAGQGPERASLEALAAELDISEAVVFQGFVPDVLPLYAAADVFVQASTMEGMPQTIVQAVAAGVPMVVTDVDGVREVASGEPHVTVLPRNGSGLLHAVRTKLYAPRPEPPPAATLQEWRLSAVSDRLARFHDWLAARVRDRRSG
ncbi:MAG: glycosyltransferase [Solirubrobacteraceae bacterium]